MKTYEEFLKQFEMTTTQDVVGAGDNPERVVIVRKKYDRKKKRKDAAALLRRVFPEKFQKKS
jgi:hypothetical protein